jgi:hypothetical protein
MIRLTAVASRREERVLFERVELNTLLGVYGRFVAAGKWRDYAIDMLADRAVFSVFQHTGDGPLYTIEKRPILQKKQGQYCVIAPGGLIVKRGHDLAQVVKVFDRKLLSVISNDA